SAGVPKHGDEPAPYLRGVVMRLVKDAQRAPLDLPARERALRGADLDRRASPLPERADLEAEGAERFRGLGDELPPVGVPEDARADERAHVRHHRVRKHDGFPGPRRRDVQDRARAFRVLCTGLGARAYLVRAEGAHRGFSSAQRTAGVTAHARTPAATYHHT